MPKRLSAIEPSAIAISRWTRARVGGGQPPWPSPEYLGLSGCVRPAPHLSLVAAMATLIRGQFELKNDRAFEFLAPLVERGSSASSADAGRRFALTALRL